MYIKDNISCVDTSRAGELALSAKHAFFRFSFNIIGFTPFNISDQFPQAECGKYPRTAGGGAGAARNTDHERRLMLSKIPCDPLVIAIVIDLPVGTYRIAEVGFQVSGFSSFWFQVSNY